MLLSFIIFYQPTLRDKPADRIYFRQATISDKRLRPTGAQNQRDDVLHADSMLHLSEHGWPGAAHQFGITSHNREVSPNMGRQICFIDNQQVGLGDARPTFPWHFIPTRDIDDIIDRAVSRRTASICRSSDQILRAI